VSGYEDLRFVLFFYESVANQSAKTERKEEKIMKTFGTSARKLWTQCLQSEHVDIQYRPGTSSKNLKNNHSPAKLSSSVRSFSPWPLGRAGKMPKKFTRTKLGGPWHKPDTMRRPGYTLQMIKRRILIPSKIMGKKPERHLVQKGAVLGDFYRRQGLSPLRRGRDGTRKQDRSNGES